MDITEEKYLKYGTSKAKKLRCFWEIETDYRVKKLTKDLIAYKQGLEDIKQYDDPLGLADMKQEDDPLHKITLKLIEDCTRIIDSIDDDSIVELVQELENCDLKDDSVALLLKNIRENIENNEPELAIDRLHTFATKYIRRLCDKNGIGYDNTKPLHGCYGEYVKHLEKNKIIETETTRKIIKSSISVLDSFNYVRNNKSYAHDNKILNYEECKFIFSSVSSIIYKNIYV